MSILTPSHPPTPAPSGRPPRADRTASLDRPGRPTQADQRGFPPPTDHHPAPAARPAPAAHPAPVVPSGREALLDTLRAFATILVVLGHWLVDGLVLGADGALRSASPLTAAPDLALVTVVLQPLALFFLVGGRTSVGSWLRARERGLPWRTWFGRRARRLVVPVALLAVGGAVLATAATAGVPVVTVRTVLITCVQPLWFLAVYLGATAVTPLLVRADARWGAALPVAMIAVVAAVDFLRYGPLAGAVPAWVGLLNVLPGWLFGFQLGVWWARREPSRRGALALLAGGLVGWGLLVTLCHYPPTLAGIPGTDRTNSHPPSLIAPVLVCAAVGAAWCLAPLVRRLASRPLLVRAVTWVTDRSMTLLCWHQPAAAICTLVAVALVGPTTVPGLSDAPDSAAWVGQRAMWLPVLFAVLLALAALTRVAESRSRLERGPDRGRARRAARPAR